MSVQSRRSLIERRIATAGEIDFASLSREFGVSEMTIRRDIDALEARGQVRRVPGGAMKLAALSSNAVEASSCMASQESQELAEIALQEIAAKQTLLLSPGPINRVLAERIGASSVSLTVFTADLKIACLLAGNPSCRVFVPGGQLDHTDHSLVKQSSVSAHKQFHCDLAIIDGVALDTARGASIDDPERASDLLDATRNSTRVIAICEEKNIDRVAFAQVCSLETFSALILPTGQRARDFAATVPTSVRVLYGPD